jgi:hypothetical protein
MPEQTKAELQTRINHLEGEIADLQEQLSARNAVARSSAEPGYLITTRNSAYSGEILGVKIVNGRGFIPKSGKHAERIAQQLANDFGYSVREISSADFEELPATPAPEPRFLDKVTLPGQLR